jgi:hypothetical protein
MDKNSLTSNYLIDYAEGLLLVTFFDKKRVMYTTKKSMMKNSMDGNE